MSRTLIIACMVLAVFLAGCKKEQAQSSPPLVPSGDSYGRIEFVDEIKTLESVIAKNAEDVSSRIRLGNLYMDAQRFREAITQYDIVLKSDPNNQNVRVDMGSCYRYIGRADMAVSTYKKAIEMQPNHPNAHLNLGVVFYDDLKAYDLAVVEFEKYIQLEPASPRRAELEQVIAQIRSQI